MGYITIQDYLSFAWLTSLDTATSTRVSILIDVSQETLNRLIWDFTYSQKSEDIKICDIYDWKVQFSNFNIISIDEINWLSFTGVLNTDYQIQPPKNSQVQFKNISHYIAWLAYPYFNIKYTSWYTDIPDEIKYLQYLLVSWEINKESWKEVKSYSLWPRSVTFTDDTSASTANQIIANYSLPRI